MTADTATALAPPQRAPRGRVTQRNVVRSEWTKLWTLRSTRYSVVGLVLLMLAGIIVTEVTLHLSSLPHNFNSIDKGVSGFHIAELPAAVLGVMVITGEYTTGMVRSTFMAVPARLPVLWAKLGVLGTVVLALTLPCAFISFFAVQAIVTSHGLQHSITDHNALRVVIGSSIAVVGVSVLGAAVGALIRSTAGGISCVVAILYLLPGVAALFGSSSETVTQYLPANAIEAFATNVPDPHMLSAWAGLAVFCATTAAILAVAIVRLRTRDV